MDNDCDGVLPASELRAIERRGTLVALAPGRQVTREDDIGRECMIVVDGTFSVRRDGTEVAAIEAGEIIGEMALLNRARRSATVTALTASRVYAFNRAEFFALLDECPELAARVRSEAEQRALAG